MPFTSSFLVQEFYDEITSTFTYVVYDPNSLDAVVIDPVWDFDPPSGELTQSSYTRLKKFISEHSLKIHFCFETHAHADHLTAAQLLKRDFPSSKVIIGENIKKVQETFKRVFNLDPQLPCDGSQFDQLMKDQEVIHAGSLAVKAVFTPGHTPACCSLLIGDCLFVGDSIFMPDTGTGRCDFPNGSAETLYDSIVNRIYQLPDATKLFMGHDYKNGGKREVRFLSTVGEQKQQNIHVKTGTQKSEFVKMRTERDQTLSAPRLLLPSLQVNMLAGHLPSPEANGVSYLKLPLKLNI